MQWKLLDSRSVPASGASLVPCLLRRCFAVSKPRHCLLSEWKCATTSAGHSFCLCRLCCENETHKDPEDQSVPKCGKFFLVGMFSVFPSLPGTQVPSAVDQELAHLCYEGSFSIRMAGRDTLSTGCGITEQWFIWLTVWGYCPSQHGRHGNRNMKVLITLYA